MPFLFLLPFLLKQLNFKLPTIPISSATGQILNTSSCVKHTTMPARRRRSSSRRTTQSTAETVDEMIDSIRSGDREIDSYRVIDLKSKAIIEDKPTIGFGINMVNPYVYGKIPPLYIIIN